MTIHGTIPGARQGPDDGTRATPAPRVWVPYACGRGHETRVPLAADAEPALWWDCATCGIPAALIGASRTPEVPVGGRDKLTHWDQVCSRRDRTWRERELAAALARRREARDAGEVR